MKLHCAYTFGLSMALATAACSAGQEPSPCHSDLEISVVSAEELRFDWRPNCGIAALAVSESPSPGEPGPTRWWIRTHDEANTIESGVVYGDAPSGTTTLTPESPLEVGQTYNVSLIFYTAFPDGQREIHVESVLFTR